MRILFLINPTAGAGRAGRRWLTLEKRLRETGLQIESCVTAGPGEATLLARKAAGSYEVVAAVGGDGTASETADGLLSAGRSGPEMILRRLWAYERKRTRSAAWFRVKQAWSTRSWCTAGRTRNPWSAMSCFLPVLASSARLSDAPTVS
jgi:hypothetical protein